MNSEALAQILHDGIPLSRAMHVSVISASAAEVVLEAPLDPNINVHGTMFGGSVATLGLLAAWSLLHLRLEAEGIANQLVIQKTAMDYLLPIQGRVRPAARLEAADWQKFRHMLERRGKARVTVTAEMLFEGKVAARMVGEFVAMVER
ncbi:YiiD C-terminal domain-containing protein [Devosia sp. YIM 151766]|uniref:YiiD C-terminal domain-containing protein n=1 Tax=Devosia sp. YIM 151766 TaxID=3017325 RepID=UPI00255C44EF|nr:YiiD C-terminal domain-containing protein [Devosia sp. YIM 151766]WIY54233.1 YiiD C-terminal domain-containing protein [Devosia sp. YIM 151766]